MKSLIFVTFAFMGFALFQLSGGDDFEPASIRKTTLSGAIVPDAPVTVAASTMPKPERVRENSTVTRASIDLTSLPTAAIVDEEKALALTSADTTDEEIVPTNVAALSSESTPAIIPSLITPNDTGSAITDLDDTDIREVTGNRVNVRGGPGTSFDVVTKLVQGDAVEILEDTGNGWVRMRPLEGGPEGWMADFLLTSG